MNLNLYYSTEKGCYFFHLQEEHPLCSKCKGEINATLIYHTIWSKNYDKVLMYCLKCIQNISLRGLVDELKYCVIASKLPSDALPIFERRPSLMHKGGLSTFQVSEIIKNSEGDIIDRAIVSKDPNQSVMAGVERNLINFQKREEELGYSVFLLQDLARDELKQLEEQKKENSLQNAAAKYNGEEKIKRKKAYEEELPIEEVDKEQFFEALQNSAILPLGKDPSSYRQIG